MADEVSIPQWIAEAVLTGAAAVGAYFIRGLNGRVRKLEEKHVDLLVDLPKTYSTREDVKASFKWLGDRLDKLDEKLDRILQKER